MFLNPFEILVDRAERPAYTFDHIYSDMTGPGAGDVLLIPKHRMVLAVGDYAIAYHVGGAVVERKTVDDLIASVVSRHKWFKGKVAGMEARSKFPCIVVEGTTGQVSAACRTNTARNTINRTMISWRYRFPKVHWYFLDGRRQAEIFTFRYLERYWRTITGET